MLFIFKNKIVSALRTPVPQAVLFVCIITIGGLQWYVLKHLPILDCLPYKPGKNIVEEMKIPAGAIPDSYVFTFIYKKGGKVYEFSEDSLANIPDLGTYEYVDRKEKVIKGNGMEAKIVDFSLASLSGNDTTLAVLNQPNYYVMLFVKDFATFNLWHNSDYEDIMAKLKTKNIPFFLVTPDKTKAVELFGNNPDVHILICDGTVVKTAARVTPTYFIMQQAYIKGKYSYADAEKVAPSAP